jgi:elongation factor P
MADTSAIRRDTFLMFKDAVHQVVDFQHVNPGKGSAFVRTRLKNIATGKVVDNTFKTSESVDVVDLDRAVMQYLYKDDMGYNFMNNQTYDQITIAADLIGDKGQWLKEGQDAQVASFNGQPLTVDLPTKLTFKVTEAMPAEKGDSAQGRVMKECTIETGAKVAVPLFVKMGDKIVVNTDTGEYVERAND